METGKVAVERVGGKSTVTRCFSKYPLKFIIPRKVGSSQTDAVWIYSLTYGGGIVSVCIDGSLSGPSESCNYYRGGGGMERRWPSMQGDSISCDLTIGDGCTTVLTTQASTKVYKSVQSKCSEQVLELAELMRSWNLVSFVVEKQKKARIGSNSLLVVIPDPVTCFSTAKYSQKQVFKVASDSSLLVVDWITSGRHESGEKWDFELYKSTNQIFLEGDQPLFLDSNIAGARKYYYYWRTHARLSSSCHGHTLGVGSGPKLQHVQNQVQQYVKNMMSEQLHMPSTALGRYGKTNADHCFTKPAFIASCSVFGPKGVGLVVRIAAMTTESVYKFLQHQLISLEPLLGEKKNKMTFPGE
ncbi:unnamed protein product [Camellia sinensis]